MSKKYQEPKRDFGFYATVPRIVRTQYKDLSHAEKWFYVCLKDLCGDKGTCFRTLRSLSEETDISIASLSKMIPNLHKYGLIHAEKKRRSESGKEVWHITIADIWAENAKVCSQNKQSTEGVVQNTNNVVQNSNENQGDCSQNEQDCSNFRNRRNNREARTSEERTGEEKPNHPTVAQIPTTPSQPENSSLPLSQKKLIEDWFTHFDQLYRKKSGITNYRYSRKDTKIKEAIIKLIDTGATFEQVEFVFKDIWEDKDPFWQEHKGKVWVVESQFATRVAKINAPVEKRRTVTGTTNYTEDRIGASAQEAKPILETQATSAQPTPDQEQATQPAKPKYGPKTDQAPTYTRLETNKPARQRTNFMRSRQTLATL